MFRTQPVIQALALGLSGLVTLGTLLALQGAAAQQHREALEASAASASIQQVVIIGQRQPRS